MRTLKRILIGLLLFILGFFIVGLFALLIHDTFLLDLKYAPGDKDKKYDMGGFDYFLGGGIIGGIIAVILVVLFWRKNDRLKLQ